MAKNEKYAEQKEAEDYAKMEDLNRFLKLSDFGRAPEKYHIDCSGTTKKGEEVYIELKDRTMRYKPDGTLIGISKKSGREYQCKTLYIEDHKYRDMLLDFDIKGVIPLYVNFLMDDVAIVYDLSHLMTSPTSVVKKIWSELNQKKEHSKRLELSLSDACIYQKNKNNQWETKQLSEWKRKKDCGTGNSSLNG